MNRTVTGVLFALISIGCAKETPRPAITNTRPHVPGAYTGPDHVTVDLLRTSESGPRIFVQATFPNGENGLFMVDTGAAISTLSEKTAEILGLSLEHNYGSVEGLGGTSRFHRAVIPVLSLGEAKIDNVTVAVGVRGVPENAYFMPLDGILGNNIWSRFVLEVDYPSDTLILHRPNTIEVPGEPAPMYFDGSHVFAPITIQTRGKNAITDELVMEVDTGASELLLSGPSGEAFQNRFSEGVEPIFGIGASEYMPASMFLQKTRRIPVAQVQLGGQTLKRNLEAKWLNFSASPRAIGPSGMRGLIGHELLSGHSVWFDYANARFSMVKSTRKKRQINGHKVLLDQDISRFGADADRLLYRAKMRFASDEREEATTDLESYLASNKSHAEASVLLAKVRRSEGDLKGAWTALQRVSAGDMVDENEIVSAVNGLILENRPDDAFALANNAVSERPDESAAYIALADIFLANELYDKANTALLRAAQIQQNPDANLLRRARVALAQGDRYGALAKIRKLIQLYPTEGTFLWFYATLLKDNGDRDTFEKDMDNAISRLHPALRPFDFMVAAHRSLGHQSAVSEFAKKGILRDCGSGLKRPNKDNCVAWYNALAGRQPSDSLNRILRALKAEGDRSDFLDTRAMVHLSRGELDQAFESALAAARLNPDDVYMLWQAERIGAMRSESGKSQ